MQNYRTTRFAGTPVAPFAGALSLPFIKRTIRKGPKRP